MPVVVVGPGPRFLSGIGYYTAALADAFSTRRPTSLLQLRKLCPLWVYPGRDRVGSDLGALAVDPAVAVFDGLDWHWGRSLPAALSFLRQARPAVVVLQWWTATTAHSYLALAAAARRLGARVVLELHETQDVDEAAVAGAGAYGRWAMGRLLAGVDAVVVHSAHDAAAVRRTWPAAAGTPLAVIPMGPFGRTGGGAGADRVVAAACPARPAGSPVRLLYFGVIRPYKGLEDLAEAMDLLLADGVDVELDVVGEVWLGHRGPIEQLRALGGRVRVREGFVPDAEVVGHFLRSDLVVLPYRRASGSGPLDQAMALGLPVVTTAVGGLVEAVAGYDGAVLVEPADPASLADGVRRALPLVGRRYARPHVWDRSLDRFEALFDEVGVAAPARAAAGAAKACVAT